MNIVFQDLQHDHNPHNGQVFGTVPGIALLLDELREMSPPFMCQFTGDNGFSLTAGLAREFGCVQYAANDGAPPYLMATNPITSDTREMEFLVGDTATPIAGRYRLPFETVKEIVLDLVASGTRSRAVKWEEF